MIAWQAGRFLGVNRVGKAAYKAFTFRSWRLLELWSESVDVAADVACRYFEIDRPVSSLYSSLLAQTSSLHFCLITKVLENHVMSQVK